MGMGAENQGLFYVVFLLYFIPLDVVISDKFSLGSEAEL